MHISYYMWCIQPDVLWEVILFCPDNCLATENIQCRWDRISWCVGIILQRELRTPGVISLCHQMTHHMSVREPLYDVNKTLTEAFHDIIIQLSFHNPNTDIQGTQPEICVTSHGQQPSHKVTTSWEVSPSSTTQGFSKLMHSISMRPYCMVCGSHFLTWGKHPQSYFFISYTNSPYACVGLIEQREISTPRVISLYHIITPHKTYGGGGGIVQREMSTLGVISL